MDIICEILGIFGAIFTLIAYFSDQAKKIVIFKSVSESLFLISWLINFNILAFLISLVAIIRNITFLILNKRGKNTFFSVIIFCIIISVFGIIKLDSFFDIFMVLGSIFYTIAFSKNDGKIMKYLLLIAGILWLIYDIYFVFLGGIITESFSLFTLIFSIYKNEKNLYAKTT